jgi:hypothetical protein
MTLPSNPFDLTDAGDYSLASFYTRATNRHDHSQPIQTPFPPELASMVTLWANQIPEYRGSRQALIRDAVMHRLKWLIDHQGLDDDRTRFSLYRARVTQAEMMETAREQAEFLKQARQDFGEMFELGSRRRFLDMLRVYEGWMDEVDEETAEQLGKIVAEARGRAKLLSSDS